MVEAYCQNDDCEKEPWILTKRPDEYASGGPKCPDCGTTRVNVPEAASSETPEAAQSQQTAREADPQPTRATDHDEQSPQQATQPSGENLPQNTQEAVEAGSKLASVIGGLNSSTPEEAADAKGRIATAAGAMVAELGQQAAQQEKESIQRSKQADQSNLERVDDYVSCPECDTQITNLPPAGEQFRCPGCAELLESAG